MRGRTRIKAIVCLIVATQILTLSALAQSAGDRYDFRIEGGGKLGSVMDEVHKTAGIQFLFSNDLVQIDGLKPVNGQYTVEEALEIALQGTGLSGGLTESGMIVITRDNGANAPNREDNKVTSGKIKRGLLASVSVFLFGSGLQTSAFAQNETNQSAANKTGSIDEILVTAQKRSENIQDVPVSVATLSPENFNTIISGGTDILALSARVPSLFANTSNGRIAPRFFIRGLGNTAFDANASQPVSLIYDDVVLENVSVKAFPLFDIGSIEVLRGPQGSLFGRNTPAGVVKFSSRRPTEETEGFVDVAFGRYNTRRIEAALGGTLVPDVLTARISLLHSGRKDFIDNIAVGFEEENATGGYGEVAGKLQFDWTASDTTEVLLNLGYHNQYDGSTSLFRAGVLEIGGGIIRLPRDEIALDSIDRVTSELEQLYGTLTVHHDVGAGTLTSISGYRSILSNANQGDVDGGSITGPNFPGNIPFLRDVIGLGDNWALETGDAIGSHNQFSQELRYASDDAASFRWLVGGYYFYENVRIDQVAATSFSGFGAPPNNIPVLTAQQFQDTNAFALFGSIDFDLSERLSAKAGLRYSDDDKRHTVFYTAANSDAPEGSAGGAPFVTDASDDAITGDFSLNYVLKEDVNIYSRFATGFQAPSVLARDSVPDIGESQYLWSIEGGVKSILLNKQIRLNATGFYYEISDHQVAFTGGISNTIGLINVDNVVGHGFEADFEYSPNENILFTAGWSLNNTKINDPTLGIRTPNSSTTVLNPVNPANSRQSLVDGSTLLGPKWIGNATLRLSQPAFGGEVFFLTDWAYRGKISGLIRTAEKDGEELFEGGVRAGYISDGGKWEFSVFGRNITNEHELVGSLSFFSFNGQTRTGIVNDPSTWGAQLRLNF